MNNSNKRKNENLRTIKRNNKVIQALNLPTICNLNPRSVYNKVDEFHTFVEEESIDLLLMSESWEREHLTLNEIINLENHTTISNVSQRTGAGGRPAIFVDHTKYDVQNVTNTLVQIPWGVEAVWCLLTPKNVSHDSQIQKIACCAVYSKPSSKKKTLLLDHISDTYNLLGAKYGRGLHYIIAGDTNDLKLDNILSLDNRFVQVVKKWTRMDPPAILDPVIMTLSKFYQEAECLEPLDSDQDKDGVRSDHRIVVCRPITVINNNSVRQTRTVTVRPFPQSGLDKFRDWFIDQTWEDVYNKESAHEKAEIFQKILVNKVDEIFPQKIRKINSDDQPWISFQLKKLDRKRKRIFHKERKSEKWKTIDKMFRKEAKTAKSQYYAKTVAELRKQKPSQWYSCLKRLSSYDQHRREQPRVTEISHLPDAEQAEIIAEQFVKIQNNYDALQKDDISVPPFTDKEIPQFHPAQVWFALTKLNPNKSTVTGDISAKLIKQFAAYLAEPLCDILYTSVRRGEYPKIYKFEISTPVPKVYPTEKTSQLRNISGLFNFDKILEKLIAELMISDMADKMDPSQYGNQKGISIQHYLIKMIHRILTVLDKNSRRQTFAVIANLIDWNNAFPRQCPKLGVESFMKNGVRPALIPVLINYFQDREMSVKWHGCYSLPRKIFGGGPQGATLGILEYLSQSNNSADVVSQDDRFKFVDDLTILEIVDLLTVGITSYNLKLHVPSDIPVHNQYIPANNLESQNWLDVINQWTLDQKMVINEKKTKNLIFNFTDNYQFSTRIKLNGEDVEELESTKLLGTIISNDLSWDLNTKNIVNKANARMELVRKVAGFGASKDDLKNIYILFVRSLLEQSSSVWHSSLTIENSDDLERIQKSAVRIIMGENYISYNQSLIKLDIESLKDRRESLCLNFAQKCTKNTRTKDMFPMNKKMHTMETRKQEKYKVDHANTERLKKSAIIYMQNLLNQNEQKA